MVRIYGFGSVPGLPDMSPFVVKAMTLLKMANVDYEVDTTGYRRAPKGKLPYIDDNGVIVADSTFIRLHLQATRNIDFDAGLTPEQRMQSWAIEKMCEDHLVWMIARIRILNEDNFARGMGAYFDKQLPPLVRGAVKWYIRRMMTRRLWQIGVGRFTETEIDTLGAKDVDALATLIGEKPYLMGDAPCAADAAVFAMLALLMDPGTASPTRDAALAKSNLVAYRDRIMQRYFS